MNHRRLQLVLVTVFGLTLLCLFLARAPRSAISHKTDLISNKFDLQRYIDQHPLYKKSGFNFVPRQKSVSPLSLELRIQLHHHFPYKHNKPIPKLIWQTWKVKLDHESFPQSYRQMHETWIEHNKDHTIHVLSDSDCLLIVESTFSNVPLVVRAYKSMPKSILKADFFRYLILFAKGGVYSDIDTACLKPINQWSSLNRKLAGTDLDAGLVVGIEADPDRPDWHDWYARRVQLCQWTIQLKPGHPALLEVVARIIDTTLRKVADDTINDPDDESKQVMDWTGPGVWTDSVFDYMNANFQYSVSANVEEIVLWRLMTGIELPLALDDTLILPITSFSPGVKHMGSKLPSDPMAFVQHTFEGSWKSD